jgi:hypothetical protein
LATIKKIACDAGAWYRVDTGMQGSHTYIDIKNPDTSQRVAISKTDQTAATFSSATDVRFIEPGDSLPMPCATADTFFARAETGAVSDGGLQVIEAA